MTLVAWRAAHIRTLAGPTAWVERSRLRPETVVSRLLGVVVAACLLTAIAAQTRHVPAELAHPRNWVVAVGCTVLALRVIAYAPRNAVGWLLLTMGVSAAVGVVTAVWPTVPVVAWVGSWAWWPPIALLPALVQVFPSGRPLSRRWRAPLAVSLVAAGVVLVGLAAASWSAPTTFWQRAAAGTAARDGVLELLRAGAIAVLMSFLVAVVSLGLRWRRAGPQQRRLLSWTIFCTVSLVVALGLEVPATLSAAWVVAATALPAATLIAIVRYGLYDIDLIVHRSVLYGSLVLILTAVYIGAVLVAVQPFPERTLAVHAAGTAAAVLAAAPLRRILQRRLDRWLYGDRARPYDVLSRLGQSLEHFLPPADVFPTVAACAAEALKLPYVGVSLDTASGTRVLVEHGRSRGWPQVRLAMTHRGTVVGELVAEARSPEERLGRRERRLLGELARQAAPAAQSVQLEQDLLRARERLVRAREDERLRIRRDLHDGVGPSLAGVRMQVDVARQLLEGRDERAGDLLGRAVQNLTATAKEVRRVVDGLRPPALDLGLLAALREVAARFSGPAFTVEVVTEGELGSLPAAVEVAAYRIAAEAVTNTARHARARHCRIGLRRDAGAHLALEIVDDGDGFGPSATAGCGTASMRERCAELGGTCRITAVRPHGTRVFAGLPLTVPRPPEGAP